MKNSKKNSPMKKIIPSACMLAISAAMLSTSTYAWFTMSDTVSVTGMKIKATSDQGLVITDGTLTGWTIQKDVQMQSAVALLPTSVPATNAPVFVSAKSKDFDDADRNQTAPDAYTELTSLTWSEKDKTSDGANNQGTGTSDSKGYVLLKNFYIKSTGETAWTDRNLVISEVTAEKKINQSGESAKGTENLDKSLRVLVVVTDGTDSTKHNEFIYAPFYTSSGDASYTEGENTGSNLSYKYKNATDVTAVVSGTDSTCTNITTIPIVDEKAINVKMYVYFEGEDSNCKSSNLSGISPDDITVSAKFTTSASN